MNNRLLLSFSLLRTLLLLILSFSTIGCMRYLTQNRAEVLLDGIDMDQTLKISKFEMERINGKFGASLPIWVIRDQQITPKQALIIKELYLKNSDKIRGKFDIWHLTWAISNIYRQGDDSVKAVLKEVVKDARKKAHETNKIAIKMVDSTEKMFLGDAHFIGRGYAQKHIVVPNNRDYLQSYRKITCR
jgi:hypothetical protein